MEQFDPEVAARVWQRVQGQREPEARGEDLRPLMQTVQELAAAYRRLAGQTSGRSRELLRRLHEGQMANLACLKGLQTLRGGPIPKGNILPPGKEGAGKTLERCYHRSRRLAGEYTARSTEMEFGGVFYEMAERERRLCALAAEAIGEMGR